MNVRPALAFFVLTCLSTWLPCSVESAQSSLVGTWNCKLSSSSTTEATVTSIEVFKSDGHWSSTSSMAGMGSTTDKGRFTFKGNVLKIEGTDGLEDISKVHWVDADHFVLTGEREVQRCRRR